MRSKNDYTGRQFGALTVLRRGPTKADGASTQVCLCVCGKEHTARSTDLRRGDTLSCGCMRPLLQSAAHVKHGMANSRIYKVWRAMHDRCYNKNTRSYTTHGARGILVCERWHTFENFYADMGEPPEGGSLERTDNNKAYTPENCRWATKKEQARNTRSNRLLTYKGETKPLAAWAEQYDMPSLRLWQRLARGWSFEQALLAPKGQLVRLYSDAM